MPIFIVYTLWFIPNITLKYTKKIKYCRCIFTFRVFVNSESRRITSTKNSCGKTLHRSQKNYLECSLLLLTDDQESGFHAAGQTFELHLSLERGFRSLQYRLLTISSSVCDIFRTQTTVLVRWPPPHVLLHEDHDSGRQL